MLARNSDHSWAGRKFRLGRAVTRFEDYRGPSLNLPSCSTDHALAMNESVIEGELLTTRKTTKKRKRREKHENE